MGKSYEDRIWVGSLVSARTGEPLVALSWGEQELQLAPSEARDLAINILQACEAAKSDKIMLSFLDKFSGGQLSAGQQAMMLSQLRQLREEVEATGEAAQQNGGAGKKNR